MSDYGFQFSRPWQTAKNSWQECIFQNLPASNQAEQNKIWKIWVRWIEGKTRDIGLLDSTKLHRTTEIERTNTVAEEFLEESNEDFAGSPSPEWHLYAAKGVVSYVYWDLRTSKVE